jgi:N-acetylglucosamine kinase
VSAGGHLWGIDLGGTKIEAAIVDAAKPGVALWRRRADTEAGAGYGRILENIGRLVGELEAESGLAGPRVVGIGTPGAVEPATGVLKNSNTVCLNGRKLREDLESALGCGVKMANDANCFALAEALWGAGRGEAVVMGLILGTGVGGGIVVHGEILEGLHGIAGEWGHNPMRGESHPCYCGRAGCVETVIAGPSLERFYRTRGGDAVRLPEIVKRADAGEALAVETVRRLREKFGEAIAAVVNVLDPDAIVVGGGVGNVAALYGEETRRAVASHVFNPEFRTKILKPQLGDSAGVFGAALLAGQGVPGPGR